MQSMWEIQFLIKNFHLINNMHEMNYCCKSNDTCTSHYLSHKYHSQLNISHQSAIHLLIIINTYQESSVSTEPRLQDRQLRNQSWIPSGAKDFSLLYSNQLALEPTQPHIQWVSGAIFPAWTWPPTTNLMQRLTMCGAIPPHPYPTCSVVLN
jgi:hypothetical protein